MFLQRVPSPSEEGILTAVKVEIWQGYFVRNRTNIANTLSAYSLDNGPVYVGDGQNLLFRFTTWDWKKKVRDILIAANIHFTVVGHSRIDPLAQLLRKKVYVVDDDLDMLYILSTTLESAGFHVTASSSGKQVMEGNVSGMDLFILDVKIPDYDGLDICRHLRAQRLTRDTPVIFISATPQCRRQALLAGANDYLEKPFQIHYLLNIVTKYTRKCAA